jgi:serine/threonine protein kinase
MKLLLNPAYKELEPTLKKLPLLFEKQGKTIYKARNELRVIEVHGYSLNVKCYRKPILINRFIYTFFRKSKAKRAYEYALVLQEKGFGTPEPMAYMELKSNGLLSSSYFVSRHIPEFRMMREFADGSDISGREDIIVAFGVFVARLHDAGILHLDLSIGNVLFSKGSQGVQFWLVDLNRMRFCTIGQELGFKNFERLRGNTDFFKLLADTYAKERGFDPTECLKSIQKYQQQSVQDFRSKSRRKQRLSKWKNKN